MCGGGGVKKKKVHMAMLKIWVSSAMIGTVGMDSPYPLSFTFVKVKVTSPGLVQVIAFCHSLISEQLPRVLFVRTDT